MSDDEARKRIVRTVYCITKKVPDDNYDMYVGSTRTSLSGRLKIHRSHSSVQHAKNSKLYTRMREVGLDKWCIRPIFVHTCSENEIRQYEKKYCEILQPDLNTYSPVCEDVKRSANKKKRFSKNLEQKRFFCNTCQMCFLHKGNLNQHKDTLKHQYAYLNSLD